MNEAMTDRRSARILVVEDEGIIAHNIERMLERMGYTVAGICHRSDEVMPAIEQERPTLVLMDIRIEGPQDGITLAERIHDLWNIPVVYLTALMDDVTLERAKITQPFGYIAKPFSQRELEITLEITRYKAAMEQRLARQEVQIQQLIDNIHQGFCLIGADGRIQYANRQFCRLAGQEAGLEGSPVAAVLALPQGSADSRHAAWLASEPFETSLTSRDGSVRTVIVTAQHLAETIQDGGCFLSVTDSTAVVRQD